MRIATLSVLVLTLFAGPLSAQGIDLQVVKLSDKGEILVTKTIARQAPVNYTVKVPVSMTINQNGKEVVVTRFVAEQRQKIETVYTRAFAALAEKDAFTDLRGKDVPLADVKKRLEKGPFAVIALKKDDAPLSDVLLGAFKEGTLILRAADPTPAPKIVPTP